jgi:hypothetical protein
MLSLLKRIFATKKAPAHRPKSAWEAFLEEPMPPPVDFASLGEKLVSDLPRCTAKVLIAGLGYGDKHYSGDVVADTCLLLPWAKHHASAVLSSDNETQAARQILPTWLQGADLSNPLLSCLTPPFRAVLHNYAPDFVTKQIAKVYCYECQLFVSDIVIDRFNRRNDGWFDWVTIEWHCRAGHLLRHEDSGSRIIRRRR